MKYSKGLIFLLLFGLIASSCSIKDSNDFHPSELLEKEISLVKVDEFVLQNSTDSNYRIGELRFHFSTNSDGSRHAFYDEQNKQFIITDSEGVIRQMISKQGRGPAEIINAGGFDFDEQNQLVVFDNRQMMIKVFDMQGALISSDKLDNEDYSIIGRDLVASEGKLIMGVFDRSLNEQAHKSDLVGVFEYNGTFSDTLGRYDSTVSETKHYNRYSMVNVDFEEEELFSTHYYNYRIQGYNLETGKRFAWFGRNTDNFQEIEEKITGHLSMKEVKERSIGTSTPMKIYPLSDYIGLYFETTTEEFYQTESFNSKKVFLAIYDRVTYDSYGDIELPYALGNVFNDHLYLIEDDHPDNFTIGVYTLKENDN